tara:strand:- start:625581 stop:626042 length:462 start_codon:yes stop_codon:yes gene_type:complete
MPNGSQAHAQAPDPQDIAAANDAAIVSRSSRLDDFRMPGEDLTIEETLRVMDVAREMRDQRETAEVMFQRDGVRTRLREKLLQQARMSGDNVTDVEIDAAIDQYLSTLNTYQDPEPGFENFLAHCWVWRGRIMAGLAAVGAIAAAGGFWFLMG